MPRILYLDSQDFSRLSQPIVASSDAEDLQRLRGLIAAKEIAVPCTLLHVEELLRDYRAAPDAVERRAALLEELSSGFCLPDVSRILKAEAAAIERGESYAIGLDSNWRWMPVDRLGLVDIRGELKGKFDEEIAKLGLNRRMRRAAQAKFGEVAKRFALGPLVSKMEEEFGIQDAALGQSLLACVKGQGTTDGLEAAFLRALGRPTQFVKAFFSRSPAPKALERIRVSGAKTAEAIRAVTNKLEEIGGLPNEVVTSIVRAEQFDAQWLLGIVGSGSYPDKAAVVHAGVSSSANSRHFALHSLTDILQEYVRQHFQSKNSRRPRNSDFADIFHASYIGYVDYWRGDRYSADLVRRALPHFAAKACSSLSEALDRVEREASG